MNQSSPNSIFKQYSSYFVGKLSIAIVGLITIKIISSSLSVADYGVLSLFMASHGLLMMLFYNFIGSIVVRYSVETFTTNFDRDSFLKSIFILYLVSTILLLLLIGSLYALFNHQLIIDNFIIPRSLIVLFTVFVCASSYMMIRLQFLRASQKAFTYNLLCNIEKFVLLILLIALRNSNYMSVSSVLLAMLISAFVIITFSILQNNNYKFFYTSVKVQDIINYYKYGIPIGASFVATWMLSVSDKYIISMYHSSTEVGIYSLLYNLAEKGVMVFGTVLLSAQLPIIVNMWHKGDHKRVSDTFEDANEFLTILLTPILLATLIIPDRIIMLFANEDYIYSSFLLFTICAGVTLLLKAYLYQQLLILKKETRTIFINSGIAAVLNVILNFIFVPRYGIQAAAISTLVSYSIYYFLTKYYTHNIININNNSRYFRMIAILISTQTLLLYFLDEVLPANNKYIWVIIIISMIVYSVTLILHKQKHMIKTINYVRGTVVE
jgi:O-antigen/teichoic acid export membrane protein